MNVEGTSFYEVGNHSLFFETPCFRREVKLNSTRKHLEACFELIDISDLSKPHSRNLKYTLEL